MTEGGLRGVEQADAPSEAGAFIGPQEISAYPEGDGTFACHKGARSKQGDCFVERHPPPGIGEHGEGAILGRQRQGVGHARIAGLIPDQPHQRVDDGSRHPGQRRTGLFLVVDLERHGVFPICSRTDATVSLRYSSVLRPNDSCALAGEACAPRLLL